VSKSRKEGRKKMKKRIVWLVVSGWMVAALLLASCAPAVVEKEEEKVAPPVKEEVVVEPKEEEVVPEKEAELVKWTGTKVDGTVVEKMLEKPRYGGTFIDVGTTQPVIFDDIVQTGPLNWTAQPVNETLLARDWTKSPVGTYEWSRSEYPTFSIDIGSVAESWEIGFTPEADVITYHIRPGVHYQDKPPLNGREFKAADAVFTLRRLFGLGYLRVNYAYLIDYEDMANSIYISPDDEWAVIAKCRPGESGPWTLASSVGLHHMVAPELVGARAGELAGEEYGEFIIDWKKVIGTGPFMLDDYVGGSSLTYVRNPNYWGYDPFFPENQLPYIDTLKVLIIPDLSTRLAGLRTGKVDNISSINTEDAKPILEANPEMGSMKALTGGMAVCMRNDTAPFDDPRVRQALWLATNFQELTDVYYEGDAVTYYAPILPVLEYGHMFVPFDELAESSRELYSYNPEKARQLLAEAGYPGGFKTEVLVTTAANIDMLSILKEYWAKIGVELELDVKDYSVYTKMRTRFTYTQMVTGSAADKPYIIRLWRKQGSHNRSRIDDPEVEELFEAVKANFYDDDAVGKIYTAPTATRSNFADYFHEQAWMLPTPALYKYTLWQPWVKGYEGTKSCAYGNGRDTMKFIWIDQDLKKSTGH